MMTVKVVEQRAEDKENARACIGVPAFHHERGRESAAGAISVANRHMTMPPADGK
jgi:hypothetical protein